MELTEILAACRDSLGFDSVDDMPKRLMEICVNGDDKAMSAFCDAVPDLDSDWLQRIFQYYMADRKEKMQDYSPESIGDLLAGLVIGDSVFDMCAGSGSLTIRCWRADRSRRFVCEEYDEKAFSLLLFNLAVRNIESVAVRCDVLSGEVFETYTVHKGDRFGVVERGGKEFTCDTCVSNPPYNMRWKHPDFAAMMPRFAGHTLPPESNANFAFVLTAINKCGRSIMVLPCGALTSGKAEGSIRQELVEDNVIDSVITCPGAMFEGTSIPTCVLVLDSRRNTRSIEMVDARKECVKEVRDQRGQYGGKSHTSRVYHKEVNVFSPENISRIVSAVSNRDEEVGFCSQASYDDVMSMEFNLSPSRYVGTPNVESGHRPFPDIVADINSINRDKGALKLTINETLARSIGLSQVYECQQESARISSEIEKVLKPVIDGCQIEKPTYIRLTKNKGEIKFENGHKDSVSEILLLIMQQWKSRLYYLNNKESVLLAELRDALLPELMSGKIKLAKRGQ